MDPDKSLRMLEAVRAKTGISNLRVRYSCTWSICPCIYPFTPHVGVPLQQSGALACGRNREIVIPPVRGQPTSALYCCMAPHMQQPICDQALHTATTAKLLAQSFVSCRTCWCLVVFRNRSPWSTSAQRVPNGLRTLRLQEGGRSCGRLTTNFNVTLNQRALLPLVQTLLFSSPNNCERHPAREGARLLGTRYFASVYTIIPVEAGLYRQACLFDQICK